MVANPIYAQLTLTGSTNNTTTTQKIGIGNYINRPNASEALEVGGNINLSPTAAGGWGSGSVRRITGKTTTGILELKVTDGVINGPSIELYGPNCPSNPGSLNLVAYKNSSSLYAYHFMTYDPIAANWKSIMKLHHDNRVVIGDVTPTTTIKYGLYVQDGILAEQIKVALKNTGDWNDIVFEPDYKLMPLEKLKEYCTKNKHLPEIPCAQEVVDNGIDVGKMNALLLKKIEELTLHLVQLNERIAQLEKNN
jgi:hypothetical protein